MKGKRDATADPRRVSPAAANSFKRRLLAWYRSQARNLPWRRTRDPYRIVVSEFMLQQTQVSRVEQFYSRFLARYPTVEALSRARATSVREAWEGLGYYRRAENLHRLAQTVVEEHGGVIPSDTQTLVRLPGVGRYTAGAVASFAYEKRAAAVDTNVVRVLGRFFKKGKRERGRAKSTSQAREIWGLAQDLLPRRGSTVWEFNQALMDLGATICVARRPKCSDCPVSIGCQTRSVQEG
jgi:A/G-specific adenine glycosylase